jgi:hypothetical protein
MPIETLDPARAYPISETTAEALRRPLFLWMKVGV